MMNRSEENQNGCREQTRNEDEGIDGILEELMAYVCDELCWFREEMQGDLMDRICGRCGLQQYTDRIREEYPEDMLYYRFALSKKGGTSLLGVIVFFAAIFLAAVATAVILAVVLLPA